MCRRHIGICNKYIQKGASDVRDDGLGFGFLGLRFRSERGGFQNIWVTCLGGGGGVRPNVEDDRILESGR